MTEATSRSTAGRSVWAVVAGFLAVAGSSVATDVVLGLAGLLPTPGTPLDPSMAVVALGYRTLYTVGGGYLTARLAPNQPLRHALVLGLIGTLVATVGLVVTWGKNLGPVWYPIALVLLGMPSVWLGARWRARAA
ncbi:MAG: hypothetical protein JSR73_10190 [Proteobacteria bacterium]|nr:hypothetical protein [Pseudomonadota bacterium]